MQPLCCGTRHDQQEDFGIAKEDPWQNVTEFLIWNEGLATFQISNWFGSAIISCLGYVFRLSLGNNIMVQNI